MAILWYVEEKVSESFRIDWRWSSPCYPAKRCTMSLQLTLASSFDLPCWEGLGQGSGDVEDRPLERIWTVMELRELCKTRSLLVSRFSLHDSRSIPHHQPPPRKTKDLQKVVGPQDSFTRIERIILIGLWLWEVLFERELLHRRCIARLKNNRKQKRRWQRQRLSSSESKGTRLTAKISNLLLSR